MTTPLIPSGMPWWVTQSMPSSASRRSSESRRTAWTPGSTSVPLPVTILKPRLSPTSSRLCCCRSPEMTSASLGSATRHMSLNRMKPRTSAPTTTPPTISNDIGTTPETALHGRDEHGPGWEVLDDHDPAAHGDRLRGLGGPGVVRLAAAPDGDHHLAQLPGADGAGDVSHLSHHVLVGHLTSRITARAHRRPGPRSARLGRTSPVSQRRGVRAPARHAGRLGTGAARP